MRCNNYVLIIVLAMYVALVFETRIIWQDALLLTALSPLNIFQATMGMTSFMPGKIRERRYRIAQLRAYEVNHLMA